MIQGNAVTNIAGSISNGVKGWIIQKAVENHVEK